MSVTERGECLLEILALTIRRDMLQEYRLDLSEMYTLLDYSDTLKNERDSLRSALSAAEEKLGVAREALKKILHEADTERELRGDPPHPTIEMGREALAKLEAYDARSAK